MGNPAVLEADSLHGLFGVGARNTPDIQEALLGKLPRKDMSEETTRYMGFGAMYWMEGVVVRRRDSRGRAEAHSLQAGAGARGGGGGGGGANDGCEESGGGETQGAREDEEAASVGDVRAGWSAGRWRGRRRRRR